MFNRIRIHVESMCRTDHLGDEFELPTSPKLENAILVINKACSDEVQRRERHMLEDFCAIKFSELKQAMVNKDTAKCREIMLKVANYHKDKR